MRTQTRSGSFQKPVRPVLRLSIESAKEDRSSWKTQRSLRILKFAVTRMSDVSSGLGCSYFLSGRITRERGQSGVPKRHFLRTTDVVFRKRFARLVITSKYSSVPVNALLPSASTILKMEMASERLDQVTCASPQYSVARLASAFS